MIGRSGSLPYRKDANSRVIAAGQAIREVTETAITDSDWTAISMPAGINCKAILITLRDNAVWKISHSDTGAKYATMRAPLSIDIAGIPSESLFYAQSESGNKTLEILFLD